MNLLRNLLLTLLLFGIGAVPAAAVDYTIAGTLTQDPSDPIQLMINGASFQLDGSAGGAATSSNTTSTESEATYNLTSMVFTLDDGEPSSCMGTPTLTLLDSVSGSDHVSMDDCETDFVGLPAELEGSFTIPGGNMATSAPADISSTSITGSLTLTVFGPENTFTFNFDVTSGSLSANGAEPPAVSIMPTPVSLGAAFGSTTPVEQVVSFTASQAVSYAISTSGGDWLDVTPTAGNTSSTITVSADPTGLVAGTYNGSVMLSYGSQADDSIPVTFEIMAPPAVLSLDPASLVFTYQQTGDIPAAQEVNVSATNGPINFTAAGSTMSGGGWLSVTPSGGDTPETLSVSIAPIGLPVGNYSGTVTISSDDANNSPQAISVTLNVIQAPLTVTPLQLTFSHQMGAEPPPFQVIQVFSEGTSDFSVSTSGEPWLSALPESGTTPATLTVRVDPGELAPGAYNGSITISPQPEGPEIQVVNVSLTVTTPQLVASPTQLTFNAQTGGPSPSPGNVGLLSSVPTGFTAEVTLGEFLSVSPTTGETPNTISVSVDSEGLDPGVYNGVVTVTPDAGSAVTIDVMLTVSLNPLLTAVPDSLTFTYHLNGELPTPQMVSLSGTTEMSFAVAASSSGWLGATPADGMTPAELTVSVDPTGLEPTGYLGEIIVTSEAASNSPLVIPVAFNVISALVFSSENLLNAAGFQLGKPPATGGLASVFGSFPGATEGGALEIPLPTDLENVGIGIRSLAAALTEGGAKGQDYVSAPLLYVLDTQVNFQIPWEIPPGPAEMIITADGVDSEPVQVVFAEVNPGIFTFDFGPGRAVAFLPNGVVAQLEGTIANVTSRPILPGEVLVILATGLGPLTGPPLPSGENSLDESGVYVRRDTVYTVRVFIGGQEAQVLFSGSSPQFVGVNQVNVLVPEGIEPGTEVTLILEVNGIQSRTDVTIAVAPPSQ